MIQQPLKDYVSYIECVRETLGKRDALQIQYEQSLMDLEKKKADKDRVNVILYNIMLVNDRNPKLYIR